MNFINFYFLQKQEKSYQTNTNAFENIGIWFLIGDGEREGDIEKTEVWEACITRPVVVAELQASTENILLEKNAWRIVWNWY